MKKFLAVVGAIILIVLVITGIKGAQEKAEMKAKILSNAESLGLEDVSLSFRTSSFEGHKLNYVTVYCSNFGQFSFDEMINIQEKIDRGTVASVDCYVSNGDRYVVRDYLRSIKKNGEEIYDDYENSEVHQSATKSSNSSITGSSTGYKTVSSSDDKFWFAVSAAKNLVKDELKSPSTAVFPKSSSEYSVERTGSQYKVTGYVDAQNSFGATIRTNWSAFFTMGDTSGTQYSVSNYSVILDE